MIKAGAPENLAEDYPEIQIEAASHYTFAMRELLKQMGIPAYLHENQLGYMLLLGFETCNEVHTDYPPHWHMIFRWPNFCGSQAPHIYLDQDGKMTENIMYVDGISGVCRKYGPEEWCRFGYVRQGFDGIPDYQRRRNGSYQARRGVLPDGALPEGNRRIGLEG